MSVLNGHGHLDIVSSRSRCYSTDQPSSNNVDFLFIESTGKNPWAPQQPPEVLGELLESRYMLPLQLPSDPTMLATVAKAFPGNDGPLESNGSPGRVLQWFVRAKQLRQVRVDILDWLDGSAGFERRSRRQKDVSFADDLLSEIDNSSSSVVDHDGAYQGAETHDNVQLTRLTRSASSRSKQGRIRVGQGE